MFFIPLYKHFLDRRKNWQSKTLAPLCKSGSKDRTPPENATDAANRVRQSYYLERRSLL